jgi:metal-responsive CopG/Arc/MetJ family transcriptional regulator
MGRFLVTLSDKEIDILDALVEQGKARSRNALVQQIISAFLSDLRAKRPQDNPEMLQSALGSLVGAFLFGIGVAILNDIFGGEK